MQSLRGKLSMTMLSERRERDNDQLQRTAEGNGMKNLARQRSHSLRVICATAVIALSAIGCASHDPSNVDGALADPSVVARLHDLALQLSSIAGAPAPMSMYAAAVSDHQAAERVLSGAVINDHAPVFVIVMTGGPFTALETPPGVPPAEGNVLTATVNAATYDVTDVDIVNAEPDLSKIASAIVNLNSR
jgi:hypothetical protein